MALWGVALLLLIPHSSACPDECACFEKTTDCSFRHLTSVPRGLPADAEWLRLDANMLTYLSHTDFPNIVRLCLNDNNIRSFSRGTFDHFPQLQILSLQDNLLQSIPRGGFDRLSSLTFIRLYGNPWDCLRNDILYLSHWIATHQDTLFDEYEGVVCSTSLMFVKDVKELDFKVITDDSKESPSKLGNKSIIAAPYHFRCPFFGCRCINETVDCTNKKFCTIPIGVPQSTIRLNMKQNNLKQLNAKAFYSLNILQLLDLSYNVISSLSNETFYGLTNLQKLDISFNKLKRLNDSLLIPLTRLKQLHLNNNQLRCLPHSIFKSLKELRFLDLSSNHLSVILKGTFSSLSSLQGIDLTANVWNCNCKDILHLVHWMRTNSEKVMSAPLMCADGSKHVVVVNHSDVSHHDYSTEGGVEDCNLGQHPHNSSSGHKKMNRNTNEDNGSTLHTFSFTVIILLFTLTQWARA